MKIYDRDNKKVLDRITLFLTPEEARMLADYLTDLYEHPEHHHAHVTDEEYQNEITVAVYTKENIDSFDKESRNIIEGE